MTGFLDRVRISLEYFRPRTLRSIYNSGIAGSKWMGKEAGKLARQRARVKKARKKAQRYLERTAKEWQDDIRRGNYW